MKRFYLALVFLAIAEVSISAQDCIETVNNSLSIVSKQNFGGPDCLFTIRFCLKKSTADAKTVEYAVNHTYGTMTRVKNIENFPVGTVFCEDFTFVAECNSTASFLAEGKRPNTTTCGVVTDFLILPIKLVDFIAEVSTSGGIALKWQTAVEENTSHFIVQQSSDGRMFRDAGKVRAAGTSVELKNYFYELFLTDARAISYFRLKMVDKDGTFSYSKIVSSKNDQSRKIRLFPNPALGILHVDQQETLASSNYKITDLNGKIIKCNILDDQNTIDVSHLQPGVYIIRIQDEILKFIKE
jgi:hypothetical protein